MTWVLLHVVFVRRKRGLCAFHILRHCSVRLAIHPLRCYQLWVHFPTFKDSQAELLFSFVEDNHLSATILKLLESLNIQYHPWSVSIYIYIYIIKYQKNQKNNDVLIYPHIISHPGIWMCSCVGFLQHFNLLRNAWNTSSSFSSFLSFFHLIECQLPRHFQCLQHQCLGSIWWSHCLPSFCPKSWRPTSNLYHSPHPNPQFASHDLHTLVLMECIRH